MDTELIVRDAIDADVSFLTDSNAAMARETERKVLDHATLQRGVRAVLAQPRRGFYLIAQRNAKPIGCLLITGEWSDWRNGEWMWLQSVYVVPEARRAGVFRALYAEAERRARADPAIIGMRLYVERENQRAQITYANLGMHETAYRLYERELAVKTR